MKTADHETVARARPKATKLPTVAEQVKVWLEGSLLKSKDLPGVIAGNSYHILFLDIKGEAVTYEKDGKPENYVIRRVFAQDETGWVPGVEPENKYLSPAAQPPKLYFPPGYKVDTTQPLLLVEGAKKAASVTKFGKQAAAVQGCQGWRSKKHALLLLPEIVELIAAGHKEVIWIPDRDRKPKAQAAIGLANDALALVLQDMEVTCRIVELPFIDGYDKTGLDDFIFHYSHGGKDVKAAMRALQNLIDNTGTYVPYKLTEPDNAKRWVDLHKTEFRFVNDDWWAYQAGVWVPNSRMLQQQTAIEMFEAMLESARLSGNSLRESQLRAFVTTRRILDVARLADSHPDIFAPTDAFDKHPLWITCDNGMMELPKDGKGELVFRPHRPEDMVTVKARVRYNPTATCPEFFKAFDYWTNGDKQLQRTVQQLLGLSFTGITREQAWIILYGPTGTGKSTLLELAATIAGGYAKAVPSDTLLVRRQGATEERKLVPFKGARFVNASETEAGGLMDENLIKQLTGSDTVAARPLYKEQINFLPEAKIWLRTNNRPVVRSTGDAFWRRVIVIKFGQRPTTPDKQLPEKLAMELEGIFAWIVRGYLDYARNGLFKAPSVLAEVETYRKEQDVMERFFEEMCVFGEKLSITRLELNQEYRTWCTNTNRVPMNVEDFKTEVELRFSDRIKLPKKMSVGGGKQEMRWGGVDIKRKKWQPQEGAQ